MKKTFIGIDNGVSGSIGVISNNTSILTPTPIKKVLKYTKKKANINRIDYSPFISELLYEGVVMVMLERPMVNPTRFNASASALRAWEATLIAIENLKYPYEFIDSKEWQKALLPSGLKGPELKKASMQVGIRLFPHLEAEIRKQKDADGILIAEYCRQKYK